MWSIQEGFIERIIAFSSLEMKEETIWRKKDFFLFILCAWQIAEQKLKFNTTIQKSTLSRLYGVEPHGSLFKTKKKRLCDDEPSARTYDKSMSLPTKTKLAHFTCCHYQGRQHAGLMTRVTPKVSPGHRANGEIQFKPEKKLVGWKSNSHVICCG